MSGKQVTTMIAAKINLANSPLAGNIVRVVLPLLLISSCAVLALQPELRLAVPLLVGVTALMVLLLAFALFWGDREKPLWSPAVILAVALLLRLFFLFAPPQLSDDIYRYLWDGGNLLRGTNPYAAAPATITPPPELKAVHGKINHPDYFTIYPPAAQLVFAGGAALGGTVGGLKALLALLDLGLCALLVLLLKRLGLPAWRAVLYAWNPLPVLEIAGSGHVDGAGLAMLIGSICLLVPDRQSAAGTAPRQWPYLLSGSLLACAGLVKLFPLVLAPVLFLLVPAGRRRYARRSRCRPGHAPHSSPSCGLPSAPQVQPGAVRSPPNAPGPACAAPRATRPDPVRTMNGRTRSCAPWLP